MVDVHLNWVNWFHFLIIQGGLIVCTPPISAVRVEPPTKFSKRGTLTEPQLLEGGCWQGYNFYKKKKKKKKIKL